MYFKILELSILIKKLLKVVKRMVLLITENWWPSGKTEEVGKKYLEAVKKYPDDRSISKSILRGAIWTTDEGMHSITVDSIKPGKVKEAMDNATKQELVMSSIEGWKYNIHIAYDLAEAMPLIGLKAPERAEAPEIY